ncbi:hypothetical protein K503DRAFT_803875 [Rhizopogon vinicolor AM-OR11-026]|uniref:REJ domain-containing protein n=1 Tax=Rhizopogon vinicolor AM-OR11-026 TaxID=1314800 RepID=A0A1B7MNA6_9AGAM|nr:hypothetical protein K503DRAFT_803875 [Rhizopogon vinicolor AM-OR11-026]
MVSTFYRHLFFGTILGLSQWWLRGAGDAWPSIPLPPSFYYPPSQCLPSSSLSLFYCLFLGSPSFLFFLLQALSFFVLYPSSNHLASVRLSLYLSALSLSLSLFLSGSLSLSLSLFLALSLSLSLFLALSLSPSALFASPSPQQFSHFSLFALFSPPPPLDFCIFASFVVSSLNAL